MLQDSVRTKQSTMDQLGEEEYLGHSVTISVMCFIFYAYEAMRRLHLAYWEIFGPMQANTALASTLQAIWNFVIIMLSFIPIWGIIAVPDYIRSTPFLQLLHKIILKPSKTVTYVI